MAAISAYGVTQHSQIFLLFFRKRIQCIALYQLHNSQALINFIIICDNFMQIKNLRNEFFNEIMLPKGYTDEKQHIMLMKMDSKEDNIKLAKFVYQLSKKRENIMKTENTPRFIIH